MPIDETKRYWVKGRLTEIRRSMFRDDDAYMEAQEFHAAREADADADAEEREEKDPSRV